MSDVFWVSKVDKGKVMVLEEGLRWMVDCWIKNGWDKSPENYSEAFNSMGAILAGSGQRADYINLIEWTSPRNAEEISTHMKISGDDWASARYLLDINKELKDHFNKL